jgi:hypothetical protein
MLETSESTIRLFLINHQNPQSRVSTFDHTLGSDTMQHVKSEARNQPREHEIEAAVEKHQRLTSSAARGPPINDIRPLSQPPRNIQDSRPSASGSTTDASYMDFSHAGGGSPGVVRSVHARVDGDGRTVADWVALDVAG